MHQQCQHRYPADLLYLQLFEQSTHLSGHMPFIGVVCSSKFICHKKEENDKSKNLEKKKQTLEYVKDRLK